MGKDTFGYVNALCNVAVLQAFVLFGLFVARF